LALIIGVWLLEFNLMPFIWDYQIISYLAFTLIGAKIFLHNGKMEKKGWLKIIGAFFILAGLMIFYGSFMEPRWVAVTKVSVNLNKTTINEKIRIVQLSDLHAGPYKGENFYKKIAARVKAQKPDLIILDGDYIYGKDTDAAKLLPLKAVTADIPTYAVLGNHEYNLAQASEFYENKTKDLSSTTRKLFQEMNVTLLENQGITLNLDNKTIYLSGLAENWIQQEKVNSELDRLAGTTGSTVNKILIAHHPETVLYPNAKKFDIILTGHTHGGQIRIFGPFTSIPDKLGKKFPFGLFQFGPNQFLNISKGLGESGPRARLFARPEINVIDLDL
jgi:predicted MPP superfamily phosphohydrolase